MNIKPILRGNKDGYIVQFKKCRGRKAALNALVSLVCDNIVDPENQIIGIAHADAYEDSLYVMEEIKKRLKLGASSTLLMITVPEAMSAPIQCIILYGKGS